MLLAMTNTTTRWGLYNTKLGKVTRSFRTRVAARRNKTKLHKILDTKNGKFVR